MGLVYSEPAVDASYSGDLPRLQTLLRANPETVNIKDYYFGDTPLIACCRRNNVRVARFLLETAGADPALCNKKDRTGLHYVSRRSLSLMDLLMICVLMPVLLLGFFILLQKQRNQATLLQMLLQRGADVDAVDYKGNTALHYLCLRKNQRLVPALLQRDANTRIKNKDGETPLDIALRLKAHKIIWMLQKSQ